MRNVATFTSWLNEQSGRGEADPIGWLALQWADQEGTRPRVSSPSGVEKHLLTVHDGDESWQRTVRTTVRQATDAYHHRGDPPAGQGELPGVVPAAAAVRAGQWTTHPNAAEFGTCTECGWPRGLADLGSGPVMVCAAGHVFAPQQPEPTTATQFDGSAADQVVITQMPTWIHTSGGAGSVRDPEQTGEAADRAEHDGGQFVFAELRVLQKQVDVLTSLVRTLATAAGLNADDESVAAMHELWTGAPGSASELITEQLAGDPDAPRVITDAGTDPATGEFVTRFADGTETRSMPQPVPPPGSPQVPAPPAGFPAWWNSAELDPPAPQASPTPPQPWQGNG
jgi:hypothetical protein